MSYNLLLDTNFRSIDKHWKLTNCEYKDGFLVGNSTTYSIEQEIVLPDPTKLYFSFDYLCFDSNIKYVYCGIYHETGCLEATRKKPRIRKRKRVSVVDQLVTEKVKVMFIVEAKTADTRICIDSPLLVDLTYQSKDGWPKYLLNTILDYRKGYDYTNLYGVSEIPLDSIDFSSPFTQTEEGTVGILAKVTENDWFKISYDFDPGKTYLVKLDYQEINNYGDTYLQYGEIVSVDIDKEQLYILFRADSQNEVKLHMKNAEKLPYLLNLKHIMIIDVTNLKIDEDDIKHLPFI